MTERIIIVLGAAVRSDGSPSPALRRRVEHAVGLLRAHADACLLFTGGLGRYPPSEAEVMARIAEQHGIAREQMLLEERAANTGESARFCAALLAGRVVGSMVLVTDAYHQRRARLAFRRAGLSVAGSSPSVPPTASRWARTRRVLREWLGLVWYGLTFRG